MGQPSPPRNNPLGHGSGRSSDRRMGTRSFPNSSYPPLARQTAFIEVVLGTRSAFRWGSRHRLETTHLGTAPAEARIEEWAHAVSPTRPTPHLPGKRLS